MRINKFIAKSGVSSRRGAEKLILDGRITVNEKIVHDLSTIIDIENDIVKLDQNVISLIKDKYYILLNKPVGYTCSNTRQFGDKIIFDLIDIKEKLFSIGRLDKDSRGLILITNDGELYNKIMHPKNEVYKTYKVFLDKKITIKDIEKLKKGVIIDNYKTNPPLINNFVNNFVEIQISEGKNRQIRKMFNSLGYEVKDLFRVQIGDIKIGNVEEGKYRNLTEKELNYLLDL